MSARIAEATALPPSSFCKRDTKTKDGSSDSDAEKEGHGLNEEGHSLEDEGLGSEKEEEAAPEDQQQAVLVVDTTAIEPLGLGYEALRHCELALGEGSVPSTFELELQGSILHDHTQRLDALLPTLFEDYERDFRELYTSAIWRPVLALEAWAGQTDAQRAALWHAIYDI
ncbi:hypothetical protein Tco_0851379 [Tanacetum coccineum]